MQPITPYIIFNGQCEEAMNFYATVFGGRVTELSRYSEGPGMEVPDPNWVMHCKLETGNQVVMMAGDGPEKTYGAASVHLSLNFTDSAEQQKVFDELGQGGQITLPLQDTFWGARFAMLADRYGIKWMLNYDKPKQ